MSPTAPQTCDIVIRNGYVLTMNTQRTTYPVGAIAVRGHSIVAVGPEAQVLRNWHAARIFAMCEAAAIPCMIGSMPEFGIGTAAQIHLGVAMT
ncbi:MAG TPA: hypothetical protein VEC75_09250, partial [Stellaceae bacterium]|nr:hypothetical protein [Stellaceae bacterium]